MAGYGEEEGTIEESEKQLIERAFAFTDLTAADVMTPRHKVFGLPAELSLAAAVEQLDDLPFSRIPLHGKDPDEIRRSIFGGPPVFLRSTSMQLYYHMQELNL